MAARGSTDTPTSGTDVGRLDWIDAARGLGIVLVVYGHALRGQVNAHLLAPSPLVKLQDAAIYAFHMPLFFLLSGLFASRGAERGAASYLRSRVRAIVYPYLLWSVLQTLLSIAATPVVNKVMTWGDLAGILWTPVAQFWFLYALLLCQLALLLPRATFYVLVPAAIAASLLFGAGPIGLRACYYLPFVAAGVWLTPQGLTRLLANRARAAAILIASWAAFTILFLLLHGGEGPTLPNLLLAAFGIAGTLSAVRLVGTSIPGLAALGRASMPIYLAHVIAGAAVRIGLRHLIQLPPAINLVLVVIAGLAIPFALYRIALRLGLAALLGFAPSDRLRAAVDAPPRGSSGSRLEVARRPADVDANGAPPGASQGANP